MSKSIDDYRNIIKILKLQLLKVREENASLSHDLGIASESETSSFTPKINHYKDSKQPFAKNILAFLLFAHRCEIIGIAPEMVFRIADKKRDKKVSANSFSEILKRLKLRMSQVQINQLVTLLKKDNSIFYQDYLQALSAFQVNSQKYPPKGSRTYVQICLLKFGMEAKQFKDADNLYLQMNRKQDKPYLTFEAYTEFTRKNIQKLEDNQIVAVFVGLDLLSQCQIEKSIFRREIGKVYSLIDRGVNLEEQTALINIDSKLKSKLKDQDEDKGLLKLGKVLSSNLRDVEARGEKKNKGQRMKEDDDGFGMQEETGAEAGNKAKKPATKKEDPGKDIKLAPGSSKKIADQLKKVGIRISQFMEKILNQESKKDLVRSFTVYDLFEAGKATKKNLNKKKIMELFKELDTEKNGTIDTAELIKLWIRAKQVTDSDQILYRLLYRHLRETQYPDPAQRFQVLGISTKKALTSQDFQTVFRELQLQDTEIQKIMISYIGDKMQIQQFCEKLKSEGKPASNKKFTKMDPNTYKEFKGIVQKISSKRNGNKNCRWRKLLRLQGTGEKSTAQDYWQFIFTDEWACWDYCLDIASKLQTFWRDPEFGPTKSDPSGMRSIVGNESDPPPALPDQSQIQWMTFQELLQRKGQKQQVSFMEGPLNANQVMQGNIGDCWYISSLSIIANKQQYLKGRPLEQCKKDQESSIYGVNPYLFKFFLQYGMYVFKFYKKFQPVYVVVDDLFPVQTSVNELLFAKSPNPGLQWPAFLEKAYAKLHHTYSSMISGDISQGLNDLTNSLPIKENLQKEKLQQNMAKIKRLNDERQLMGCSISADKSVAVQAPVTLDDQRCGLFYSHAYSIIDFLDLNTSDKNHFDLIRVRNPWGHSQWLLDWSDTPLDNNPEYQKFKQYQKDINAHYEVKKRQGKKMGKSFPDAYAPNNDGEFLMNYSDFNNLYTNLFTGFTIQSFNARYEGRTIAERWDDKIPSGICKLKGASEKEQIDFVKNNHQYILEVNEDDTDILMYIVQEDGRLYRGEKYPYQQLCNPTLILIFTLDKERQLSKFDQNKLTVKNLNFERRREVNSWNKFKKGRYAIIPCKMKNKIKETDFEFRIYHEKTKRIDIRKNKGSNDFKVLNQIVAPEVDSSLYTSFIGLLEKSMKKA